MGETSTLLLNEIIIINLKTTITPACKYTTINCLKTNKSILFLDIKMISTRLIGSINYRCTDSGKNTGKFRNFVNDFTIFDKNN